MTRCGSITINEDFGPRIIIKDSKFEEVDCVEEIQQSHPPRSFEVDSPISLPALGWDPRAASPPPFSSHILRDQDSRTKQNNTENAGKSPLHRAIGMQSRDTLLGGDLNGFADLMNTPWEHKKKRSPGEKAVCSLMVSHNSRHIYNDAALEPILQERPM
jgi:hypothetical protein